MVDCAVQGCAGVARRVDGLADVVIIGFDVHVVDVEKVVYRRCRLLRVLAITSGVECQTFMRVGAAGDEMVEECEVATRGNYVE
jgi:hypothetical protein